MPPGIHTDAAALTDRPYRRITSLVPSLTELIVDLAGAGALVSRTRFCTEPAAVSTVAAHGGTKNPDVDAILAAAPELVVANREENRREDVERLAERVPVWLTDVAAVEDALAAIADLGVLLGAEAGAAELATRIAAALPDPTSPAPIPTAYLIWRRPWMTVGGDTYIDAVLARWGLANVFGDQQRYPTVELAEIGTRGTELVLLSSEPFPFGEPHRSEVAAALPDVRVELVDGSWFSWYGSRMATAFPALTAWREAL